MTLLVISSVLLLYLGQADYQQARDIGDKASLRYQKRSVWALAILLLASTGLYHGYADLANSLGFFREANFKIVTTILFAFAISYLWFLFFRALDIFEKEKLWPLILLFVMACGSTFLVFPIGGYIRDLGFVINGEPLNDFLFSSLAIGVPEELVKILPFLLMLRFSKNINEPYDYILYGGICALGFAFVENIGYLGRTGMMALAGRAFYSTVSHVFDTSIICYFLAIAHYKKKNAVLAFLKGFVLAALAHGFYDFWLISDAFNLPFVTIIFFLASIHMLSMMINNLLNISPYFKPERRLRTAKFKFYLTTYLVALCVLGFIYILFSSGPERAFAFAKDTAYYQSYTLAYLVVSVTSLNIVHGYLMPLTRLRNILFPLVNRYPNYLGLKISLDTEERDRLEPPAFLTNSLPAEVTLGKRLVLDGDINWYSVDFEDFPEPLKAAGHQLIARPVKFNRHLLNGKPQLSLLGIITKEEALGQVEIAKHQIRPLGKARLQAV